MAKEQTEKSGYPSRYSPGEYVTGTQFCIEIVCANKAAKDGKGSLPIKFWNLPEWKNYFIGQTRAGNKLVKQYGEKALVAVVKERHLLSLRPKWVEQLVAQKAEMLNRQVQEKSEIEAKENPSFRTQTIKKSNSIFSKLKEEKHNDN